MAVGFPHLLFAPLGGLGSRGTTYLGRHASGAPTLDYMLSPDWGLVFWQFGAEAEA
jgi:hypothetical protein